ncbi:class I SAM-dependent methyltransferase [Akkermansiaceae bacterium]|nr:class I SAM-dependent methyltransferase [Akkermansiaceae bacterium]
MSKYIAELPREVDLSDIDLNQDSQLGLLKEFSQYYADLPYGNAENDELRYSFDQEWFCHSDAIMLYSFLRHFKPGRIIEVGSGYSSAVILDTLENFDTRETQVTFIDPYPDRLQSILRPGDGERVEVLAKKVQDVDLDYFRQLKSGDLLFIDSSHVLKVGSDLHHILFKIVPQLPVGVHLHFHDIFYPFEYPAEWLKQGRYWNELYILRAFLAGNSQWEVTMFNDFVNKEFGNFLGEKMPACRENFGGSLYLTKVAE